MQKTPTHRNPPDEPGPRPAAGGHQARPLPPDPARYAAFTFFEWLEDEYFRQWVRHPSIESDAFFTALRTGYPEQESAIADARVLLGVLSRPRVHALPAAEAQALWHRIQRSIDRDEAAPGRAEWL